MGDIVDVLVNQGVAVAMCLAFVFMMFQVLKNHKDDFEAQRQDNKEREERDRDTITRLSGILSENSKALLKNSEVMQQISGKVDIIEERIEKVQEDIQEIKIKQASRDKQQ